MALLDARTEISRREAAQPAAACGLYQGDRYLYPVAVARTAAQQAAGLRGRAEIAAMLFDPAPTVLTMEGVSFQLVALSLSRADEGWRVVKKTVMTPGQARYELPTVDAVLEVRNADAIPVGGLLRVVCDESEERA